MTKPTLLLYHRYCVSYIAKSIETLQSIWLTGNPRPAYTIEAHMEITVSHVIITIGNFVHYFFSLLWPEHCGNFAADIIILNPFHALYAQDRHLRSCVTGKQ